MNHFRPASGIAKPPRDLQMAAWIGGGDEGSARPADVVDLAAKERLGLDRLRQRVHAGAAAAPRGFR